MKDKTRLVRLNNAIFNGNNTAMVIQINMVRDKETIPDPCSRYEINLDFDKATISRGIDYADINPNFALFQPIYDESRLTEDSNLMLINKLTYTYSGLSSVIIGNADIRKSDFNIAWIEDEKKYAVINNLVNDGPMDHKILDLQGASSGSVRRHFAQRLDLPNSIISLLIVYPNTVSIPLVFGYKTQNPDVSLLFSEDPDQIYSSFTEQFEFYDELVTMKKSMVIGLDTEYYKANAAVEATKNENLWVVEDEETGKQKYMYEGDHIAGYFFKDGTYAEFHLEAEDTSYILYAQTAKTKYNSNQFQFFKDLVNSEPIPYDSENAKNAKVLLMNLCADSFLFNYLQLVPLGETKIYDDECNLNTYHVLIKDEMHGCNKLITLYGGDFVMIREYYNLDPLNRGDFTVAIFKLAKSTSENAVMITNSKVKFDYDDNNFVHMVYSGAVGMKFSFNGHVQENTTEKDKLTIKDVFQKFNYSCIDVENLQFHKLHNPDAADVSLITKFDSLFYNVHRIDDIIIRNYLGLPVNHRYISIV